MPKLIIDRQIVEDRWQLLAKDASEVPAQGAVIAPLALWLAQREALLARGDVGVWLDSDEEIEALAADLPQLPLLAVNFPAFTDGRSYSTARLARERYGYRGEIRAIGDVWKDVMFYLSRCGCNAFAVRADKSLDDALAGLDDFSEVYQGAVLQPLPLFRRRAA